MSFWARDRGSLGNAAWLACVAPLVLGAVVCAAFLSSSSQNVELLSLRLQEKQARLQELDDGDLALGNVPLGPGVPDSMQDFPDDYTMINYGHVLGPTWALGTYESTVAPARTRREASLLQARGSREAKLQKLADVSMGTGQPFFQDLQNARDPSNSRGAGSRNAGADHMGKAALPDPFPSFKEWEATHKSRQGDPPSEFDMIAQENGPDSQPVGLSRLYTSPDAALIHSAAVAAGAAYEDGGGN